MISQYTGAAKQDLGRIDLGSLFTGLLSKSLEREHLSSQFLEPDLYVSVKLNLVKYGSHWAL